MMFRSISQWLSDGPTAKAMALLGPAAFGPPCSVCGKRQPKLMPPRYREYGDRISMRQHGKPLADLEAFCHCEAT